MIIKLLTEHHLAFLSFKGRLQRLFRVYTCQNATLLEISCTGSILYKGLVIMITTARMINDVDLE